MIVSLIGSSLKSFLLLCWQHIKFYSLFKNIKYKTNPFTFFPPKVRMLSNKGHPPTLDMLISIMSENNEHLKEALTKLLADPVFDRAMGTVCGAFIADSLGSYCEFEANPRMGEVMKMQGGGTFGLNAGQITDDSEMALHMAYALDTFDPTQPLEAQHARIILRIAEEYIKWYNEGNPFDIGMTCSAGIRTLIEVLKKASTSSLEHKDSDIVKDFLTKISQVNFKSESNGSLMRITPMAAFIAAHDQFSPKAVEAFVKSEVGLIHGSDRIQDASYEWVNLLATMIRRPSDQAIPNIYENLAQKYAKHPTLGEWYYDSQLAFMNCMTSMGWAKIAWTSGVKHLSIISDRLRNQYTGKESEYLNEQLYTRVMNDVISKGGDTDTNGCIVGGLIGSLVGFKKLPKDYLYKMMTVDVVNSRQSRKTIYRPINIVRIMVRMFSHKKA